MRLYKSVQFKLKDTSKEIPSAILQIEVGDENVQTALVALSKRVFSNQGVCIFHDFGTDFNFWFRRLSSPFLIALIKSKNNLYLLYPFFLVVFQVLYLVYHGCFELVLESHGKNPIAAE